MKTILHILAFVLVVNPGSSQRVMLNKVIENSITNGINGISQDKQGYIWLATNKGLIRYDGTEVKSYLNDPLNTNSVSSNFIQHLCIDSNNIIWIAAYSAGLDSYDPSTNTFTHYRHRSNDPSSIITDSVFWLLADHANNLWVGTKRGLDLLDRKTGKFTHYLTKAQDTAFISSNFISALYEDRKGVLWVGVVDSFGHDGGGRFPAKGFLSRFDKTTGKFISYVHDPADPGSIEAGLVRGLYEDSKGNFWIGTANDGLQQMDRDKGRFIHYYYDPAHPEKPSRPPLCNTCPYDPIAFIREDAIGGLWIGTLFNGINRYDPVLKKNTHYGSITKSLNPYSVVMDTSSGGFNDDRSSVALSSKDGLLWIGTFTGALYNADVFKTSIPFHNIRGLDGNTFYTEGNNNILWIGTDSGLIQKNRSNGSEKIWRHNPQNPNTLSNDTIAALRVDSEGKFWMATVNGLSKFDPLSGNFKNYKHNENVPGSLGDNLLNNLCIDHNRNIWIGTTNAGLDKLDVNTQVFTHYRNNTKDTGSLSDNNVYCIAGDGDNVIWAGTNQGLNRLDNITGKFHRYLKTSSIRSIFVDHAGVLWVGGTDRLFRYERTNDQFLAYTDPALRAEIKDVMHIMEDNQNNLWVSTANAFIKINEQRDEVRIYGENYGVHKSLFSFADNFKAKNGELFFGDQTGYYTFLPGSLKGKNIPLQVNLISFSLGDEEVKSGQGNVLTVPIWKAEEINLSYSQNIFSFDFGAINFTSAGEIKYLFKLENYDNTWHFLGTDHKAYFFNVPPGTYIFHAKAVAPDGVWGEKTIKIIITPPWWRTWWAYTLFGLLFIGTISAFMYWRSKALRRENRLLEEKVTHRTIQLQQSIDQLKATQSQLIQSEKMASLGELTAGIAHEIQNPLNFVNNFSEVNKELLTEMNEEIEKGNYGEVKAIAKDVSDNEEKIIFHGKRADSIVKGMLQHSRSSNGIKEPTDINALCDEYLRLCYHGLRAKDKSFNATLKTDFDETIGKINIVPQDMGRVILNLLTNAFYAVNERKKLNGSAYEPTVSIQTKKSAGNIEIRISDNGNGIPQKTLDKIFQPFFTTKPTGQGTGLGLSLSYDIIKAHGGDITVDTSNEKGTVFTIQLPIIT